MEEKKFESDVVKFWLEDGVLCGIYKKEEVDYEAAVQATKERLAFCEGKDFPCLADYTRVKTTTKAARDYLGTEDPAMHIKAIATLVNSPVGMIIGNFYMRINRPQFPFRLFTDRDKAIEWLKKFID